MLIVRVGYRIALMVESSPAGTAARWSPLWARAWAGLWTVVLVAGLLTPALPALPGLGFLPWHRGIEQASWLDKVIHAVLFWIETWLLARPGVLHRARATARQGREALRRAVVVALMLAVLTEVAQAPIPTRVADWGDFAANLAGIALAVALGRQTR